MDFNLKGEGAGGEASLCEIEKLQALLNSF